MVPAGNLSAVLPAPPLLEDPKPGTRLEEYLLMVPLVGVQPEYSLRKCLTSWLKPPMPPFSSLHVVVPYALVASFVKQGCYVTRQGCDDTQNQDFQSDLAIPNFASAGSRHSESVSAEGIGRRQSRQSEWARFLHGLLPSPRPCPRYPEERQHKKCQIDNNDSTNAARYSFHPVPPRCYAADPDT